MTQLLNYKTLFYLPLWCLSNEEIKLISFDVEIRK